MRENGSILVSALGVFLMLSIDGCAGAPPTASDRLRASRCAAQAGTSGECDAACIGNTAHQDCLDLAARAEGMTTTFTACYSRCARPAYCGAATGPSDWDCNCWSDCVALESSTVQQAYLAVVDCVEAIPACR